MRLRPLALGATIGVVACSAAHAQISAPTASSQRDLGFGAQVSVLYDTNTARSNETVAAQRGLILEDTTITPTVNFNVSQPLGQNAVFLNSSAGYQFHDKNKKLDRQTYAVSGGGMARLGMCQATVFGTFNAAQADIADLDTLTTTNLRRSIGRGATLQCGRPTGFGGNVGVQKVMTHDSEQRLRTNDSDSSTISVGLGYTNPVLGTVGVNYAYNSNEFPNRIIPGRPIGDGFFSDSYGLTVQRDFGSRLSVSGAASRIELKREFAPPGASQKLKGTTYAAQADYAIGSRITVNVGASRSVRPSGRPGKLFDIAETANLNLGYKLGSRFDISLGHTYARTKSNQDTLTPVTVVTSSELNSTSASIGFATTGKISLNLDVRYDERVTNLPEFDYTATIVGVRAGAKF